MSLNLGNGGNLTNLEQARQLLEQVDQQHLATPDLNDMDLEDFTISTIKANVCSTISIKYEIGEGVLVCTSSPTGIKVTNFPNYDADSYMDFCEHVLGIDPKERFNCSRSKTISGVKSRIYAVMPPLAMNPILTISTTKIPPMHLEGQNVPDELLNEVIHSTAIICGGSGSGKTYLFNYMLNKFIRDDERIGIIEEFMEIVPPNKLCYSMICPPPKPGEKSLLRFMTEQSNLMRLDSIFVGEIKGAEAWPFIVNLASGTRGAATIHGATPAHAISRLRALCELDGTASPEAISEFISKAIKYVVQMRNRRVVSISKLNGTQNRGIMSMDEVFNAN